MRKAISTPQASPGGGPYSQGIAAGHLLFVSGQGPIDSAGHIQSGDIEAETRLTLDNIRAIVEAGGYTMDDVVQVGVYLASMADFDRFNAVYRTYFNAPYPARSCIEAGLDGIKVEVDAIACKTE
ncbi:RidA family protein [Cohnella sp. JJ-181]|uniref:RidA family protein n=1 Tax=Cohnella rhizoplanae TaxID=2974897 RepID=UPI0022FF583B|nr:Rid family detoxifying hydrolase [Cohnella sp. JJ-181]CAI6018533.1 2-iminobutanoate/2-iminopropanoate deaminase [Cohnella sp. JJ-181]